LSLIITKTITGIIANDYRKIYGDIADEGERGPNPKGVAGPRVLPMMKSTAPNPKELAGPKEMMEWWW